MKKICFISSAGGHLEQVRQLKNIISSNQVFYVTNKTIATKKIQEKKYLVSDLNRQNKFNFLLTMMITGLQQLVIFFRERPDVVVTTGAGLVIPMCLIAKLFKKKVIYIESFARIHTPNRTGLFVYKFADLFIIQWEELKEYYPEAIYGGSIY